MATTPAQIKIRVFEHNPTIPTESGKNPLQIDEIAIPYIQRIPRRERAAVEAVERKYGRKPTIQHTTSGDVTATIGAVVPAQSAAAAPRGDIQQAILAALREPAIMRELAQALKRHEAAKPDR